MEKLDSLIKLMKPKKIYFEKADPVIEIFDKEASVSTVLFINELHFELYPNMVKDEILGLISYLTKYHSEVRESSQYIKFYTNRLESFLYEFKEFKNAILTNQERTKFVCENLIGESSQDYVYYNDLEDDAKSQYHEYFKITLHSLETLIEQINEMLVSVPLDFKKIKLNLSVGEIALLFRLFYDNGNIDTNNKEELYRSISAVFQTPRQDQISTNSIRKKFNDPEDRSDIDALLVNLRMALKKID